MQLCVYKGVYTTAAFILYTVQGALKTAIGTLLENMSFQFQVYK